MANGHGGSRPGAGRRPKTAKLPQSAEIVAIAEELRTYRQAIRALQVRLDQLSVKQGASPGFVYLIGFGDFYKIGLSVDPNRRMRDLNLPGTAQLIHVIGTNDMGFAEGYLHDALSQMRGRGEWFALTDDAVRWVCSLSRLDNPLVD